MKNFDVIKATFISAIGAIGSFIAQQLGGWTTDMRALIILMCIDVSMGFLIAAIWNRSSKSETGKLKSLSMWKGICRKGVTLLIVLVSHQLDTVLGMNYIRTAVIIAFIVDELISIIENANTMGVKMPTVITKAIELLKDREESTNGES